MDSRAVLILENPIRPKGTHLPLCYHTHKIILWYLENGRKWLEWLENSLTKM